MWDSLKTTTGPSAHQLPPPELKKRPFLCTQTNPLSLPLKSSSTSANSSRNGSRDSNNDSDNHKQAYWQTDFDNRLNGLGIQNGPSRYEIRRGKTVPQPDVSGPRQLNPIMTWDTQPKRLDDKDYAGAAVLQLNASSYHVRQQDEGINALHWHPMSPKPRYLCIPAVHGAGSRGFCGSPPLDSDDLQVQAPPRNPRRLQPDDDAPWRPSSSVYGDRDDSSRHSRHHRKPSKYSRSRAPAKDMYGRPIALEISPPSSPELDPARYGTLLLTLIFSACLDLLFYVRNMRWFRFRTRLLIQCLACRPNSEDVSPIDDGPDMSQLELIRGARDTPTSQQQSQEHPRSHIPTMHREKPRDQDRQPWSIREVKSTDNLNNQSNPVNHLWEADEAQPRSYEKAQPAFGLTTIVTGPQAHRSGNPPSSFGQRIRKLARGKPDPVERRPPWNGASGRAPLVDPVHDDPSVAPLNLQRMVSKRIGRSGGVSPEASTGAAATVRRLLPSRSNQKLKDAYKTPSPEPQSRATSSHACPSPPYSSSPPETRSTHTAPLLTPNMMPDQHKAIKRKPSPSTHTSHASYASYSSSVYSALTDQTVTGQIPLLSAVEPTSLFAPEDPWVQPPSRFSVTTCNTTVPDTPGLFDQENRPPMPSAPKQLPSVMDRRRPVPGDESSKAPSDDPIVISMQSATLSSSRGGPDGIGLRRTNAERPVSTLSTDKALPPAPPEMQSANDRVAYLTARLDDLTHQRMNINRSIKQMTELMPTDNLLASTDVVRKREVEKKKVDGLREDLAEIQREEHDLGLKLYRANKRLEREGNYESSSLWVRRVTAA
ncbi:hypothetical protein FZEAL_3008 [Fusarium zealandicum]|uniref:Uncharacterized protein n=1 Tax=Fusarium zealandicum TaxID=1053134 RepID=A0A8H4XNC0_9HYPO|nr:hypothetical protein FZEAL_3008 [Fusarium zealandicum]